MISWMLADISSMENNISKKAVFFDRDGTLNVDTHYLYRPEEFVWIEGAVEAIKYCNDCGYLAVVITNQSGVARGYYQEEDILKLFDWMNQQLAQQDAHLDGIYYCPHYVKGSVPRYSIECDCRKPKPGMLFRAAEEMGISLKDSYLIGDSDRDIACAEAAGAAGIKYEGGSLLDCLKKRVR